MMALTGLLSRTSWLGQLIQPDRPDFLGGSDRFGITDLALFAPKGKALESNR